MKKVLVVSLNPTFQKTYMFEKFHIGEVNRELFHREDASGKGVNVARVLTQKNINNTVLTHLHSLDEERMLELTKKDNINLKYALDSQSRVRTCSTLLSQEGETTEIVEESDPVSDSSDEKIRALFDKEIRESDYLLITGTRSGNYKDDIYSSFVEKAKSLNKKVILDICKEDLKKCIKFNPDIIKPNLSEFMKTFYDEDILENYDNLHCKEKVISKTKQLFDEKGIVSIITRGIHPMWVYNEDGFSEIEVVKSEDIVNTIGCGDALTASLIANLIQGKSLKQALINASYDAKLNAENIRPGSLY